MLPPPSKIKQKGQFARKCANQMFAQCNRTAKGLNGSKLPALVSMVAN